MSEQEQLVTEEQPGHWLQNFIDIMTDPISAGARYVRSIIPAISFAILISALSISVAGFILSKNGSIKDIQAERVRTQLEERQKKAPEIFTDEVIEQSVEQTTSFSAPLTVGISIPGYGILMFLLGGIFYGAQRLFNANEIPYTVITTIVAYGATIHCIGILLTALMAFALNTPDVSFSLAMLVSPDTSPMLAAYLQSYSVFAVWEYIAVGIAVASQVRLPKQKGYIIGAIAFVLTRIIFAVGAWVSSLLQNIGT